MILVLGDCQVVNTDFIVRMTEGQEGRAVVSLAGGAHTIVLNSELPFEVAVKRWQEAIGQKDVPVPKGTPGAI